MERLGEEEASASVTVHWHPFMIDPQTKEEGEDYMAYNERRWGSDGWTRSLRAKGANCGAPFANWKTWPNTFKAHQLMQFAPHEKEGRLKHALFEAIYEKGQNVSDVETLCRIATDNGVDANGFRKVLDTTDSKAQVRKSCEMAKARGVTGVPFFVLHGAENKQPIGFSGAVDTQDFLKMFHELL